MDLIREKEPEAYKILEAACVDEETLLDFSRDDIKDLFDGVEYFMLRRKLWKILEKLRESNEGSDKNVKNKTTNPCNFKPIDMPFTTDQTSKTSTPSNISSEMSKSGSPALVVRSSTPSSLSSETSRSSSPALVDVKEDPDCHVVVQPAPVFVIYTDSELAHASPSPSLSNELLNRLVRNTVSNMRTSCQRLPTPREPTNYEIEEMARALVKKFPCVRRLYDDEKKEFKCLTEEERCNLTEEQKSRLHNFIFTKLKKRHTNVRPAKNPQGSVPSRSHKRIKLDLPKKILSDAIENIGEDSNPEETDPDINARHYTALNKEQKKKTSNKDVINKYLNVEFPSRKKYLEKMAKEERPKAIFDSYPCFKDPCEVVGEVRRSLKLPHESSESYMEKCVQNLKEKLDPLTYFGISKGALRPPKNVTNDGKIKHLMKGINTIFKTKKLSAKQVKADEVFHIIEDDEGPSEWQRKRSSYTPGLVVTDNGAALLLGREIFILFEEDEIIKAVVTLLASFYLLDFDYPLASLFSFSILQRIIFNDNSFHPDCKDDIVKGWNELELYCNGNF